MIRKTNFCETNSGSLFTEALTTQIKTVFTDDTSLVGAQPTGNGCVENLSRTW
jgi:hypothetical protein